MPRYKRLQQEFLIEQQVFLLNVSKEAFPSQSLLILTFTAGKLLILPFTCLSLVRYQGQCKRSVLYELEDVFRFGCGLPFA